MVKKIILTDYERVYLSNFCDNIDNDIPDIVKQCVRVQLEEEM